MRHDLFIDVTSWNVAIRSQISSALKQDLLARWLTFFCLYALFAMPIILANTAYIDDLGRSLRGYAQWNNVGRPITNILMRAVNFDRRTLTNLAPLPLLLSIVVLSLASAWASIGLRLRLGVGMLALGIVVCNPFFLENLSYQFDSLPMSLAVCSAMMPLLLSESTNQKALFLFGFVAVLVSLNLYQPSTNVFIVAAFFNTIIGFRGANTHGTVAKLLVYLACYVTAMLVYKVETYWFPYDAYSSAHSKLVGVNGLGTVLNNIQDEYNYLSSNLLHTHQTQILLMASTLGAISAITGFMRGVSGSHFNRLTSAAFSVVLIVGILAGIAGPITLLESPVWVPRVMIGFGAAAACLILLLVMETQFSMFRKYVSVLVLVILLGQVTISYSYGNALSAQASLEKQIASEVVEDVYSLKWSRPSFLIINGTEPMSPRSAISTDQYPVVKSLLPMIMDNNWYWGWVLLQTYGLPENVTMPNEKTMIDWTERGSLDCSEPRDFHRRYYDLFRSGSNLILDFTKTCTR